MTPFKKYITHLKEVYQKKHDAFMIAADYPTDNDVLLDKIALSCREHAAVEMDKVRLIDGIMAKYEEEITRERRENLIGSL